MSDNNKPKINPNPRPKINPRPDIIPKIEPKQNPPDIRGWPRPPKK